MLCYRTVLHDDCQTATDRPEDRHAYEGRRLPMNAFEAIILNETSGTYLFCLVIYLHQHQHQQDESLQNYENFRHVARR